jgi:intracellular sulfur oxidation DsrE/DsrF family protein
MKKKLLFILIASLFSAYSYAQKVPYNVVIDVTSPDTVVHKMVLRWVNEITSADPTAKVEVVFYGKSLDMITMGKSVVEDKMQRFSKMENVAFRVCQVAMKSNKVEESDLIPGVKSVPDGIYEIVLKQHDNWAYIKAAR